MDTVMVKSINEALHQGMLNANNAKRQMARIVSKFLAQERVFSKEFVLFASFAVFVFPRWHCFRKSTRTLSTAWKIGKNLLQFV
jgi:hypothetical protein